MSVHARRVATSLAVAGVLVALPGCRGSRTRAPDKVLAPSTTLGSTSTSIDASTTTAGPPTTASKYISAGEKHPLANGGTLSVSYPVLPVRPGQGIPPPPAGKIYAVIAVTFCAAKTGPSIDTGVDAGRFRVEVPGEGIVAYAPGTPELRKAALPAGASVKAGTCLAGTIAYAIGGEQHIEAILYDTGDGLLRWAS